MEQKSIPIKAQDEDLKARYSNVVQISHANEEFILDFFLSLPPQGTLVSRVIISPGHAKRIVKALEDNIKKYEQNFGNITEAETPQESIGFSN